MDDQHKRKRRFKEYCCGPREFMAWIILFGLISTISFFILEEMTFLKE